LDYKDFRHRYLFTLNAKYYNLKKNTQKTNLGIEMKEQILVAEMKKIFREKGGEAFNKAKSQIGAIYKTENALSKALFYFSKATLSDPLPVFPAFVTISCEAVGGSAEIAVPFGEAIFLIACAADLHDDIIDQSFSKGLKKTVFGKFGTIETILAGDTLLTCGLTLLNEACASIPKEQGEKINRLAANAVYELCIAESLESQLRTLGLKVKSNDYNAVIKLKAVFHELTLKMGAIVGKGNLESIEALGRLGRTFGEISTIAEEFSDLLNPDELINRLKNECPPLPLIYALQNRKARTALMPLLITDLSNEKTHGTIVNLALSLPEVKSLAETMQLTAKSELEKIGPLIKRKSREELETVLLGPLEFINAACFS
jgi:geranylgeranyl pyrophosphate synthase